MTRSLSATFAFYRANAMWCAVWLTEAADYLACGLLWYSRQRLVRRNLARRPWMVIGDFLSRAARRGRQINLWDNCYSGTYADRLSKLMAFMDLYFSDAAASKRGAP